MWQFVTWNLDWLQRHPEHPPRGDQLRRFEPAAAALQEVKGGVAKQLRRDHDGPSVFSQELHPDATWGWMGCGLLLAAGSRVLDSGLVEALPKPQRGLWARVAYPSRGEVTVVSWHTPNAARDDREVKMAAYRAMSDWLRAAPDPVVLGADLNTWIDPVALRPTDPTDPFYDEHALVGPEPAHGLVDAYRAVLDATGDLDRLATTTPDGPRRDMDPARPPSTRGTSL